MKVDIVCPLYKADDHIDALLAGLCAQKDVELANVVFPVTYTDGCEKVIEKIANAGFSHFIVQPDQFSHSLTREKAIYDYCSSDVIVMLSQDVKFVDDKAISILAEAIHGDVIYAFGRQIVKKKTIEFYTREKNYGAESTIVTKDDVDKLQLKAFFASDAFSAYNREQFVKLGGYDHIHMMMSEDMYYAKKVLDNGYSKAYVAEAVVEHSHKFTLKQLYARYYETGKWFAEHPEFDNYKTTDSGLKLALYVLKEALKDFNIKVLFRWLPDMTARYLGMKKGKRDHTNKKKQYER